MYTLYNTNHQNLYSSTHVQQVSNLKGRSHHKGFHSVKDLSDFCRRDTTFPHNGDGACEKRDRKGFCKNEKKERERI